MQDVRRVVLTGFSGSGKSTVALLLAARLGWRPIDNDQDIEIETGMTIPELFATQGEAAFRQMERAHLLRALERDQVVIATGGGACVDEALWTDKLLYRPGTLVITLDAQPDEMLARMKRQAEAQGNGATRPMLAGDNPLNKIEELKRTRQEAYDRAHVTLPVDRLEADQVADEILQMVRPSLLEPCVRMNAASGSTAIHIGPGATDFAGELIKETYSKAQRTWIISDANVDALHGKDIETTLLAFGLRPQRMAVAAGEGSKSLETAGKLYDWMLNGGIERGDVVVALGGGVTGDLAGFVAATALRGVGLVQIPTTLLATVDSSIGGKTGINHETGKNLIGAFYQPPLVVIDTRLLATLPPRELRSGFGEIVKHAIIQPSTPNGERADLIRFLERNAHNLRRLSEPVTSYMISRNIKLKAAVVEHDERETGIRAFLNFGHTLGHAIEAAGYRLLHGEAIAVGMRAAMRIGRDMGTATDLHVRNVDALIDLYGLPKRAPADPARVMELLGSDKKRKAGRLRWVLPMQDGGVTLSEDVPIEIVQNVLREVIDPTA